MGIRHRCINSTATISRRSGIRTCTVRAHPQGTSGIDPGDGAASGTHGMDVDHRHRDGDTIHQRIPLSEMSGVATDQTDIGARSTHVKGDRHTSIATLLSCHHSARRTGEHRLHRLTGQCGPGSGRTGGIHHPQLCRAQSLGQILQVPLHHRSQNRCCCCGTEAFPLPRLCRHLMREDHRQFQIFQKLLDQFFIGTILGAVKKADGNRLQLILQNPTTELGQLIQIRFSNADATRPPAQTEAKSILRRNQRCRRDRFQIVELRPVLTSKLKEILEPTVGDQSCPRMFSLQQCVGRHRRPMNDLICGQIIQGLKNRASRIIRGRGDLLETHPVPIGDDDVRKGASTVDPDSQELLQTCSPCCQCVETLCTNSGAHAG